MHKGSPSRRKPNLDPILPPRHTASACNRSLVSGSKHDALSNSVVAGGHLNIQKVGIYLVRGPKQDVELEGRAVVHDRLGVELSELRERAALAKQPRVEEVGGVAPRLQREVRLPLAGEVGELEDSLGERQLDELPLVRQQRATRCRSLFFGRGTVPGLASCLCLAQHKRVGLGNGMGGVKRIGLRMDRAGQSSESLQKGEARSKLVRGKYHPSTILQRYLFMYRGWKETRHTTKRQRNNNNNNDNCPHPCPIYPVLERRRLRRGIFRPADAPRHGYQKAHSPFV